MAPPSLVEPTRRHPKKDEHAAASPSLPDHARVDAASAAGVCVAAMVGALHGPSLPVRWPWCVTLLPVSPRAFCSQCGSDTSITRLRSVSAALSSSLATILNEMASMLELGNLAWVLNSTSEQSSISLACSRSACGHCASNGTRKPEMRSCSRSMRVRDAEVRTGLFKIRAAWLIKGVYRGSVTGRLQAPAWQCRVNVGLGPFARASWLKRAQAVPWRGRTDQAHHVGPPAQPRSG